jgi:hypothetical protein
MLNLFQHIKIIQTPTAMLVFFYLEHKVKIRQHYVTQSLVKQVIKTLKKHCKT